MRELRVAQQAGEDWAEEGGMHIFKVVNSFFYLCGALKCIFVWCWCNEVYICRIKRFKHLQGGQGSWQDDDGEGLHGRTFESRKGPLKRRIAVMKLKPLSAALISSRQH